MDLLFLVKEHFLDSSFTSLYLHFIVNIYIVNEQNSLLFSLEQIEPLVKQVLTSEGCTCDEISINFVDEPTICQLHLDFFNDPSPTDCITFPIDEDEDSCYRVLGEVFICPYTALKYASENNEDPYLELTLYVVHGLLHLLGYDDIDAADEPLMRAAEKKHMTQLTQLNMTIKKL